MVKGLKVNDRVRAKAIDAVGANTAASMFPETWKTLFLFGTIVKRNRGRSVSVRWDRCSTTNNVSTRLLQREEPADTAIPVGATTADATTTATVPAATPANVSTSDSDSDSEDMVIEDFLFAGAETVSEEEGDGDEENDEELDRLLKPHGLVWEKSAAGVTVDEPDVARRINCRLVWHDGLDNARQPIHFFCHLYPISHIKEMFAATNPSLEALGFPPISVQEYLQFVGLMFAMSFYPKFSMRDLFSPTSEMRRSNFLTFCNLSIYMTYRRALLIMKHLTFATTKTAAEMVAKSFWKVEPLVAAFNCNRKKNIVPGIKLVVDESISEWKGKDQRFGADGCPHVTKIIRKPRGVGMEVKNLADCDSGIMMALETVAGKDEMRRRPFAAEYGAGTSLLIRLCAGLKGTGRVIIADSAFASVKSGVALKKQLGLFFLGCVKTAHSRFPKKYLQSVPMATREAHVVLTAEHEGVRLRAVGWNDGKKDNKTGRVIRKCIVGTCGTTLPGTAHRKRRWRLDNAGHASTYFVEVPRPLIVDNYFSGAQKIDVHNHRRQGPDGVRLEARSTKRWEIRFWQTMLGMIEVDSFLAYTRWCPGKSSVKHNQFLRVLTQQLLDNTVGCAPDAPVLRPRPPTNIGDAAVTQTMHQLKPLSASAYFIGRKAAAVAVGKTEPQTVLKCRVCRKNASFFCATCSTDTTKTRGITSLCGLTTGRECFYKHQTQSKTDSDIDIDDLI